MTSRSKKLLANQISTLSETEHMEILKILDEHGVPMTRNANGVFLNLTTLDSDIIQQIERFVDFSISNKASLDDYDRRLSDAKINNDCRSLLRQDEPLSDAYGNSSDAGTPYMHLEDWNSAIRHIVNTPRKSAEIKQFNEVLAKAHVLDQKMQKKTIVNNRFQLTKKKYSRRTQNNRFDNCDLPDHLKAE